MLYEVTGGNARHVFFGCNLNLDGTPAVAPSTLTANYVAHFEASLREWLEGHWMTHAVQAHSRQLSSDEREKHVALLLQFVRSPDQPVARANARTFADFFMDWGALTIDRDSRHTMTPAVQFVSPIARAAVLSKWLQMTTLSSGRVAFEQEVR